MGWHISTDIPKCCTGYIYNAVCRNISILHNFWACIIAVHNVNALRMQRRATRGGAKCLPCNNDSSFFSRGYFWSKYPETRNLYLVWIPTHGKMVKFGPPDRPSGKTGDFPATVFFTFWTIWSRFGKKKFQQKFSPKKT